jgi:hypothetical protein
MERSLRGTRRRDIMGRSKASGDTKNPKRRGKRKSKEERVERKTPPTGGQMGEGFLAEGRSKEYSESGPV